MTDGSDRERQPPEDGTANVAPDAVKDPNEKTDGKPGQGPKGGQTPDDETDPGSG